MKKIVNLVNHQKVMAEKFLSGLIAGGSFPAKFSGIMAPKFGNYIYVWQFNNNKLVGACIIHKNNIENLSSKLHMSVDGMDWSKALLEEEQDGTN